MSFIIHPSFLSTREHPLSSRDMNFSCISFCHDPTFALGVSESRPVRCCCPWVTWRRWKSCDPPSLHAQTPFVLSLSPSESLTAGLHDTDIIFMINEGLSKSTVSLSCYGQRNASSKHNALPISCSNCTAISAL